MLLTIDFLILNFKGTLIPSTKSQKLMLDRDATPFVLELHQYGNKVFKDTYDVFYLGEKVGAINASPRSNIIDSELIQFQFENHLFYTKSLNDLGQIVHVFVDYFDLLFTGINRLDIALDKNEPINKYKDLYFDIMSGTKLLKGREKNIAAHSETKKGVGKFNGFTVGKRSSARFLRIYNKSVALLSDNGTKQYITDYYAANGLCGDIWRFEYQLNSRFFTDLRKYGKNITFALFEPETLYDLISFAVKNHFEVVENTGKTETNKENDIEVHDWVHLKSMLVKAGSYIVSKIKRIFTSSITIQKRLCKSLFRQYYVCQGLHFLYPLIVILKEYDLTDWFMSKYDFYMREFQNKELLKNTFNEAFFVSTFNKLT